MSKGNIKPHIYLDSNIILDAIHIRWQPSVDLMKRIETEQWQCSTSHFTILEILDAEQEEQFIENRRAEGLLLSRIVRLLGDRRRGKYALKRNELDAIYVSLHDILTTKYSFITFERPLASFWDDAERFCAATNIGATDSIHLATAIGTRCDILVTRDKDFQRIANDYILAIFPENIDKVLLELAAKTPSR